MKINREETPTKGRFTAFENDTQAGAMTYSLANDGQLLIVDHTEVDEAFKGQGIGKQLFEELVNQVRSEGKKIMPLCPFVRAMFEKHKDQWDVLRHQSL